MLQSVIKAFYHAIGLWVVDQSTERLDSQCSPELLHHPPHRIGLDLSMCLGKLIRAKIMAITLASTRTVVLCKDTALEYHVAYSITTTIWVCPQLILMTVISIEIKFPEIIFFNSSTNFTF